MRLPGRADPQGELVTAEVTPTRKAVLVRWIGRESREATPIGWVMARHGRSLRTELGEQVKAG